jgi:hypothetical protein
MQWDTVGAIESLVAWPQEISSAKSHHRPLPTIFALPHFTVHFDIPYCQVRSTCPILIELSGRYLIQS